MIFHQTIQCAERGWSIKPSENQIILQREHISALSTVSSSAINYTPYQIEGMRRKPCNGFVCSYNLSKKQNVWRVKMFATNLVVWFIPSHVYHFFYFLPPPNHHHHHHELILHWINEGLCQYQITGRATGADILREAKLFPSTAPGVNSETLWVELQISAIMMMPLHKILKKALHCRKFGRNFVINLLVPLGSRFTCPL